MDYGWRDNRGEWDEDEELEVHWGDINNHVSQRQMYRSNKNQIMSRAETVVITSQQAQNHHKITTFSKIRY